MIRLSLFTIVFLLFGSIILPAQNFNRPVPPGIPPYEFVLHDSSYQGYYLTTPFRINAAGNAPVPALILDSKGFVFWYMLVDARNVLDFTFNPEQQRYQYVKFQNPQKIKGMLLDSGLRLLDSVTTQNGVLPDVHDFQISKNGTFLLAGVIDSVVNLSAYQFNGMPGSAATHAIGFVVQELDEDRHLLFQWNSNDYIHPGAAYVGYPYSAGSFDYCHGNTIEEDTDGNLLISFRNLDAVYKIERQTGAILWQLGGKTSSFSFTNDPGFSGQHDVRRLPNGNIAMFDNANMAAPPQISRTVEYRLDTLNWTATKVWEYKYAPAVFSPSMGGHQTTPDRRHLINYGLVYRPDPSVVLIDDSGALISELFFQDSFMSYRSTLHELPLGAAHRPVIACSQNGGIVSLSAPPGLGQYAWSTGATTANIEVQTPGVYQVWVPYGAGMLGSEPFVIEDLSTACPLSSVSEAAAETREIEGYYDLLGRRVAAPVVARMGGQIYLVRYSDGWMDLRWR